MKTYALKEPVSQIMVSTVKYIDADWISIKAHGEQWKR